MPLVPEVCIFFENDLLRGNRTSKTNADNFNAFRVLKYLNFVHESCYSKIDILSAANKLLAELNLPVAESLECALQIFRKLFR